PAVALGQDLAALRGIAWRAAQRVGQGAIGAAATARRTPRGSAWQAAAAAFAALRTAIEEAWPDARPDDAQRESPPA
ncbi:MAG: hypothetical protein ACE5IL_16945, partial [Myxococcota bacterium]